MKSIVIAVVLWCAGAFAVLAQDFANGVPLSATELLQYERTKTSGRGGIPPFKKYQFERKRATKYITEADSVQLWGYHIAANLEYDRTKAPLYRVFKKKDMKAMAVIDHFGGEHKSCDIIFWHKQIYRRYATQLRRAGFELRQSEKYTNVLEFRKPDVSVGVDMEIWNDIYIMHVKLL